MASRISRWALSALSARTLPGGSLNTTRSYLIPANIDIRLPRSATPARLAAKASTIVEPPTTQEAAETVHDSAESPVTPNAAPSFFSEKLEQPPGSSTDWSKSYHGLSTQAFSKEVADILLAPIDPQDVEMKPGMYAVRQDTLRLTIAGKMVSYIFRRSNIDAFSTGLLVPAGGASHLGVRQMLA
jgi:hypothetical protein